jgi:hypothetical protein
MISIDPVTNVSRLGFPKRSAKDGEIVMIHANLMMRLADIMI